MMLGTPLSYKTKTRKECLVLEPTAIYDGDVTVKMTANHVYYVQYKDEPKWKVSQGVTGVLEELYDQRALISWAAGQAAGNVVKTLAGESHEKWLDEAFLEIYKGQAPIIKGTTFDRTISGSDLIHLYESGISAHVKKAQYGKDVGTQVHDAIDNFHRTGEQIVEPSEDPKQDVVAKDSFDAYLKWYKSSGLKVLETERVVHSRRYNYCGTLDRIYIDKNGNYLIADFKTSNVSKRSPLGIRGQYWSQVGAYAAAYSEETGLSFVDAIIVNSSKNGGLKVLKSSSINLSVDDCVKQWHFDLAASRQHKVTDNLMKEAVNGV